MALSSGNIGNHEFSTSEDFLPDKNPLEKDAKITNIRQWNKGTKWHLKKTISKIKQGLRIRQKGGCGNNKERRKNDAKKPTVK